MLKALTICVAAAAFATMPASANYNDSLSAQSAWSGRNSHLAVVNPVCGDEPGTVLDLGGEWTFAAFPTGADRSQFFNMRQLAAKWSNERKINVPGTWESQGV